MSLFLISCSYMDNGRGKWNVGDLRLPSYGIYGSIVDELMACSVLVFLALFSWFLCARLIVFMAAVRLFIFMGMFVVSWPGLRTGFICSHGCVGAGWACVNADVGDRETRSKESLTPLYIIVGVGYFEVFGVVFRG